MRLPFMEVALRSIGNGAYDVPFLHLNTPRLVTMTSRCKLAAYAEVFGTAPAESPRVYCCAQFVVARDRILARPLEMYQRMFDMLGAESPDECADIKGHSTFCLMYEVLWHILFGEPESMPMREENPQLPLFLRAIEPDTTSNLPKGSFYLGHVGEEPQWG